MKILIVEDDLLNRTHMADLLSPYGHCDLAASGQEALAAFDQAVAEAAPYDLITLDIIMPGLDGQEVLREVRSREAAAGIDQSEAVKVIMITSMGDADTILESFDARCDSFLTKPITEEQLGQRLLFLGLAR